MALRLFPFFCPWKTLLHHHQKATHLLPPPSCWWPSMQMTFSQVACATTRSELFSKDNISVAMLFPSNFKDFATKNCFVNRIWILLSFDSACWNWVLGQNWLANPLNHWLSIFFFGYLEIVLGSKYALSPIWIEWVWMRIFCFVY